VALDQLEERLATQRYLVGDRQRLVDYPNLWAYTRELYQVPGIVPKGPVLDLSAPHGRC